MPVTRILARKIFDGLVKGQESKNSPIVKSVGHEARNLVLEAFYENKIQEQQGVGRTKCTLRPITLREQLP